MNIFKEIQQQPEKLFEMIRVDIRESVGEYPSGDEGECGVVPFQEGVKGEGRELRRFSVGPIHRTGRLKSI
jgi:hypothetical protein